MPVWQPQISSHVTRYQIAVLPTSTGVYFSKRRHPYFLLPDSPLSHNLTGQMRCSHWWCNIYQCAATGRKSIQFTSIHSRSQKLNSKFHNIRTARGKVASKFWHYISDLKIGGSNLSSLPVDALDIIVLPALKLRILG